MADNKLTWQSKLVMLAVLPFAGTQVVLDCNGWASQAPAVAIWVIGVSALLGVVTWRLRAATPAAALTGATITASLMFSTAVVPYEPWRTALIPTLAVSVLAFVATRAGRHKKERLGTAETHRGRSASQVAANLGFAALVASSPMQSWLLDARWLPFSVTGGQMPVLSWTLALAALAEAAADTVSSEIGQVLGGRPRMITSFKSVAPGRDGAISLPGTLAGMVAAAIVAYAGMWALGGGWKLFAVSSAGAVFGLFFDSLLGATFEERGLLNNDAVNFLSTISASGFALAMLCAAH